VRHRICRIACLTIATAALWASGAGAQELEDLVRENERQEEEMRRIPGTETPGMLTDDADGRTLLPDSDDVQRVRIAQDRRIDPEGYIVGPGDVMQLYIWGEFDQDIRFEVNPEGLALVPTVGAFEVSGRTLAEVKAEIITSASRDKYPGVEITLSLQSMRFFTVYITGAVLMGEGAHVITPVTRLTDLIELAGGFLDDFKGTELGEAGDGQSVRRSFDLTSQPTARRAVIIHHVDGTTEVIDLAMFVATGDIRHNPYVRMGDLIHVGFRKHQVFVYGAVNEEGNKEFRTGDTVGDLILLSRGVSGSAPLAHVEIWRFVEDTDSTVVIPLIHQETGAATATIDDISHIALQPQDMLFVRTRSDWRETPTAFAHGELPYTGRYRITLGQTTLTQFVQMAGGFSDNANLVEAKVIRTKQRAIKDPELGRLQSAVSAGGYANLTPEERAYLKSKQREERGRLAIDFERLFVEGDMSQDVFLEGGDVVFVPERRLTVSMSGQFLKPGLAEYEAGRRGGFYLAQAGGYGFNAKKSGARLIRARTGQREKFETNLLVEPGDEIWVPEKEYRDWWSFVQGAVRSTAEALTLILLVRAI
jgi:protein involved in polysaccharide export with SLBB domain